MSFVRAVPKNVGELRENFATLFKNKSHVKKVEVNLNNTHLEVSLDFLAHAARNPDFFLPIKRGKVAAAKDLVEKLMRSMDGGFAPSDAQIQELYDMIDPTGQ